MAVTVVGVIAALVDRNVNMHILLRLPLTLRIG
jgi:hypothetical protein